jgi:hypothetical protein
LQFNFEAKRGASFGRAKPTLQGIGQNLEAVKSVRIAGSLSMKPIERRILLAFNSCHNLVKALPYSLTWDSRSV